MRVPSGECRRPPSQRQLLVRELLADTIAERHHRVAQFSCVLSAIDGVYLQSSRTHRPSVWLLNNAVIRFADEDGEAIRMRFDEALRQFSVWTTTAVRSAPECQRARRPSSKAATRSYFSRPSKCVERTDGPSVVLGIQEFVSSGAQGAAPSSTRRRARWRTTPERRRARADGPSAAGGATAAPRPPRSRSAVRAPRRH